MLNGKKWQSFITSNLDHSYVLSTSKKDTPWPHGEYVCTWTYLLLTLLHRIEDYFLGHSIWDDTISLIFAPQRSGFVTLPDSERPTDRLPPKQHSLWKPRGKSARHFRVIHTPTTGLFVVCKELFSYPTGQRHLYCGSQTSRLQKAGTATANQPSEQRTL